MTSGDAASKPWALVPVKRFDHGKSRLGDALSAEARAAVGDVPPAPPPEPVKPPVRAQPPVQAQLWVSAKTSFIADEDFGHATRTPTEHRGEPGIVVDFSCKNPDYLISRVLGAAGTLRVLAPQSLRSRAHEAAAAVSRRNASHHESGSAVASKQGA